MDAGFVVFLRAERLTPEERDVGIVAACWAASVGLLVAFIVHLAAPRECTEFLALEFFACGRYAAIAAIGEMIAAASVVALVFVAPRPAGRLDLLITWLALAAALAATVVSPIRLFVAPELLSRFTAATWSVIGLWIARSGNRVAPGHATMALCLGLTAGVWGWANVVDDAPRPLPIGGGIFAIFFLWWTIALTRSGMSPSRSVSETLSSSFLGDLSWALSRIGLVILLLPIWTSATFGVAMIGDPALSYEIHNTTSRDLIYFISDPRRLYGMRVGAGATEKSSTLEHGVYEIVANAGGEDIFCARLTDSQLRRLHNVIVIRDDPSSCR